MPDFPTFMPIMTGLLALAALIGHWRPAASAWIAGAAAAAVSAGFAALWASGGGGQVDLPWFTPAGSRLVLELDALAAPMTVFVSALAAIVLFYTAGYMPQHIAKHGRDVRELARFSTLMLGFMLAMLLLAVAQDLLVIFTALEVTALLSFLLIEFDRDEPEARRAARTALLVTAGTALAFLVGLVLVHASHGTTALGEILAAPDGISLLAAACLIAGVLSKSAQMPLHFWLPRAMVAPTPVSAYLHSAALVAAGVYVLIRLRPLFEGHASALSALEWIGFATLLVGGLHALTADEFKRILAYSTIAQYGHVLVMLGAGGDHALAGAPLFIVAHGLSKGALFLTAGAVTTATGADRLSEAKGTWRDMPLLAAASAIAAAGLAGMPATMGYFKEEVFFSAAVHSGWPAILGSAAGAALTVAYIARFWLGIFGAKAERKRGNHAARHEVKQPGRMLVWPVAILAAALVATGLMPGALGHVFAAAGEIASAGTVSAELAYRLSSRPELWITLAAWTSGLALVFLRRRYIGALAATLTFASERAGPAALAQRAALLLAAASDRLHTLEVRDLRDRLASVLLPAAVLVALGVFGTGRIHAPPGPLQWSDAPLAMALLATAVAALVVARARGDMAMVLLLSFVGFSLAITFSVAEAPEVALVVVIIETLFTLLFVTLLARIPAGRLDSVERSEQQRHHGAWTAVVAGTAAFFVAWFALGEQRSEATPVAYANYTQRAHAEDTVSAIVADFRGLDTLGEITVLVVALLGAIAISRGQSE